MVRNVAAFSFFFSLAILSGCTAEQVTKKDEKIQYVEMETGWLGPHAVTDYKPYGDKLPLMLQDHDNPVRFRNIWIREIDTD